MTIAQTGKWILGGFGAIGVVWTGVKNIRDIAAFVASLNGWAVLFLLAALALFSFGVIMFFEWLNKKFEKQDFVIHSILTDMDADRKERLKQQQQLWDAIHELQEQLPHPRPKSELG